MCRTSQHRVQELSVRNLLVMPMFPDCAWTNPRQILAHRVLRRGTTHLGLMTTRISTNLRYPARHHLIMTVSLSAAVRHPVLGQGCFLPTRVSRPMLGQGSFLQNRVSRPTRAAMLSGWLQITRRHKTRKCVITCSRFGILRCSVVRCVKDIICDVIRWNQTYIL